MSNENLESHRDGEEEPLYMKVLQEGYTAEHSKRESAPKDLAEEEDLPSQKPTLDSQESDTPYTAPVSSRDDTPPLVPLYWAVVILQLFFVLIPLVLDVLSSFISIKDDGIKDESSFLYDLTPYIFFSLL